MGASKNSEESSRVLSCRLGLALLGGGLHIKAGRLRLPLIGLPFARRGSGVKSRRMPIT